MAISNVFLSIKSPDISPFLTLLFWSYFCLIGPFKYVSLFESLPQPWCNPLWLTGFKAPSNQLTDCCCTGVWCWCSQYFLPSKPAQPDQHPAAALQLTAAAPSSATVFTTLPQPSMAVSSRLLPVCHFHQEQFLWRPIWMEQGLLGRRVAGAEVTVVLVGSLCPEGSQPHPPWLKGEWQVTQETPSSCWCILHGWGFSGYSVILRFKFLLEINESGVRWVFFSVIFYFRIQIYLFQRAMKMVWRWVFSVIFHFRIQIF